MFVCIKRNSGCTAFHFKKGYYCDFYPDPTIMFFSGYKTYWAYAPPFEINSVRKIN